MADPVQPDKVNLFNFMVIRPPDSVAVDVLQTRYIYDSAPGAPKENHSWYDVDFQKPESPSAVGHAVYEAIFCDSAKDSPSKGFPKLVSQLLSLLQPYYVPCDDQTPPEKIKGWMALPIQLGDLERHSYLVDGDIYYLLPDQLDTVDGLANPNLILESRRRLLLAAADPHFDVKTLLKGLVDLWGTPMLHTWVFVDAVYTPEYLSIRRKLFDALYLLYVLRRQAVDVSFEGIIHGLQTLHTLEALAIDEFLAGLVGQGALSAQDKSLLALLTGAFPVLKGWDRLAAAPGFPRISDAENLTAFLSADPVVHPLFGKLFYYRHPFNNVKPLGVGDLKVVKQWLIGYIAGEISDIHNIMKGENKTRIHRRMEKTDQIFSSTSDQEQEFSKDTQSTDRFEVKKEAENIVKSDLNINANTNVQYKSDPILVSVGAGFSYANASTTDTKTAQNYSREVVSKAVSRVQSHIVTTQSVTQIFETRELNKHSFESGTEHISGIYRWLDKQYKAQLYNYGKRLMFEFILPEPAAFYVESRLRAFEASLDVPQPPALPQYQQINMPFKPSDIDEAKFNDLRTQYDLSEFTYPAPKSVTFLNSETNQALFEDTNPQAHQVWYSKTFACNLNAAGYQIVRLKIDGDIYWANFNQPAWKDHNLCQLLVDGNVVLSHDYTAVAYTAFYIPNDNVDLSASPCLMAGDSISLILGFQNTTRYELQISADLEPGPAMLSKFQGDVFKKIRDVELQKVNSLNDDLTSAYKAALNTYKSRIQDLKGTVINDLLQGRSEAANADVIRTELKRQCLSFFTKEFDADSSDDLLTDMEAMGSRDVNYLTRRLVVHEKGDLTPPTTAAIDTIPTKAKYPLPLLDPAERKGRYIQFLEQAFEWQELSWIFYPYFWATTPKWVDMTSRNDTTDPTLTAFLRAGSARILISVTPAYDAAVLHFLATREPWNGGPAPVIGDPLYLPLYQEMKNQQDDLGNAVPEGDPWTFRLPTSLVYLEGSTTPLPTYPSDAPGK